MPAIEQLASKVLHMGGRAQTKNDYSEAIRVKKR